MKIKFLFWCIYIYIYEIDWKKFIYQEYRWIKFLKIIVRINFRLPS